MKTKIYTILVFIIILTAALTGCGSGSTDRSSAVETRAQSEHNPISLDFTVETTTAEPDTSDNISQDNLPVWKKAYVDYIGKNINFETNKYGYFIYLNNDEIPEIFLKASFAAAADRLLWIDADNNVHNQPLTAHTTEITYQEKTGQIFFTSYQPDYGIVGVSVLADNELKRVISASYTGSLNFTAFSDRTKTGEEYKISDCKINGEPVSYDNMMTMVKKEYDYTSDACKKVESGKQFETRAFNTAIYSYTY